MELEDIFHRQVNMGATIKIHDFSPFNHLLVADYVRQSAMLSVIEQLAGLSFNELLDKFECLKSMNPYFYDMVQQLILGVIFLAAVFYLGRILFRSFKTNSGCASGCGKCGAVDFVKIEQQIKDRKL